MITIHQVGPSPDSSGGMASVIQTYMLMTHSDFKMQALPTWKPQGKVAALGLAFRAYVRIAGLRRARNLVHVHLSERGSFVREGLIVVVCKLRRIPVIATLHGAHFTEFSRSAKPLVSFVLKSLDHVVALGPDHKAICETLAPKVESSVILNPIDMPPNRSPRSIRNNTVLFAGEIGRRKGFDRIVAAWRDIDAQDWSLKACGPQSDFDIGAIVFPTFSYLGSISREGARREMEHARIVCLPSRAEVLPMTILEAIAAGTHVVATRVGEYKSLETCPNISWISSDEEIAVDTLKSTLQRLIRSTTEDRAADEGIMWVKDNASLKAVGDKLFDLYEKVRRS